MKFNNGPSILIKDGNLILNKCKFENINRIGDGNENGNLNGSVINGNIENGKSIEIIKCEFISCNISGDDGKGGSIYINVNSGGLFKVNESTIFKDSKCNLSSNGYGGGIYLLLTGDGDDNFNYNFESIIFDECDSIIGKNIYIEHDNGLNRNIIKKELFKFISETTEDNYYIGNKDNENSNIKNVNLEYYFFKLEDPLYVSISSGLDVVDCGIKTSPCKSISICLKHSIGRNKNNEGKIIVNVNILKEKSNSNSNSNSYIFPETLPTKTEYDLGNLISEYNFVGKNNENTDEGANVNIEIIQTISFEKSLIFENIIINGADSDSTPTTKEFHLFEINKSDSTLKLIKCNIENMKFNNGPSILIKDGNLILKECKFENINRIEDGIGVGGV
jgi:hypothetical protein